MGCVAEGARAIARAARTPYAGDMIGKVQARSLPNTSLLCAYRDRGAYTDCYTLDVADDVAGGVTGGVSLERFITAFYQSRAFRLERFILALLLGMKSSDAEAAQLGAGSLDRFAAWSVEARRDDQILLCDYQTRTRSWLMVLPILDAAGTPATRLHFGTAVTQVDESRAASAFAGFVFWALLWFHKAYARVLLAGVRQGVKKGRKSES
jgi:hypothetical protein